MARTRKQAFSTCCPDPFLESCERECNDMVNQRQNMLNERNKRNKRATRLLEQLREQLAKDPKRETRKRKVEMFFSDYKEVANYIKNCDKHKKSLFVYDGVKKMYDAIIEHSMFHMEDKAYLNKNYDFVSTRVIDAHKSTYSDIVNMTFESTYEDKYEIEAKLNKHLDTLVYVNKGYTSLIKKMMYKEEIDGRIIKGGFTPEGIVRLSKIANYEIYSHYCNCGKPPIKSTLIESLYESINDDSFSKFKFLGIKNVKSDDRMSLPRTKRRHTRPQQLFLFKLEGTCNIEEEYSDIVVVTLKEGENRNDLPLIKQNPKMFKQISLGSKGKRQELKVSQQEDSYMDKIVTYKWTIKNDNEIYCNGKFIVTLSSLQFRLFECLCKMQGKDVENETIKKCWDNANVTNKTYTTTMGKISGSLEDGLSKVNMEIPDSARAIKPIKKGGKVIAYKLII